LDTLFLNELARAIVASATFLYAGIEDWRKRDISPWTWVPGAAVGVSLSTLEVFYLGLNPFLLVSLIVTLLIVVAFAIAVFLLRAMGGADFLAVACLASLMPFPFLRLHGLLGRSIVPPLLHVMLYSALLSLAPVIANVVHNARRKHLFDSLRLSGLRRVKLFLTARVLTIEELERKRFYYPLYVPGVVDRSSFDVEEDDRAWVEKLREAGARLVVATWGVPTVTLLCVATLIYLSLGVSPIDAAIACLR